METWESQSLHLGCRSLETASDCYPKSPVTTHLFLCFRSVKQVSSTAHFHCYDGRRPHSPGSNENELWSENPLTVSQAALLGFPSQLGEKNRAQGWAPAHRAGCTWLLKSLCGVSLCLLSHLTMGLRYTGAAHFASLSATIPWGPLSAESSLHFSKS